MRKFCDTCGKMFETENDKVKLCDECLVKDKDDYRKVKDFLMTNPGSNMFEVSKATGVSIKKIKEFISDDRVQVVDKED